MMNYVRPDGRTHDSIRPLIFSYDVFGYAPASVMLEQGNTKVLASVTLQPGVPSFLKGQKKGWLSAEYALLPTATHQRTNRESSQAQRNARSVEISRLIGRCLRTTIDLDAIGERSITIDCDVLQADGSTRVACITAASLALKIAAQRWSENRILPITIYKEQIAGVSVGVIGNNVLADLSYAEDFSVDADFNFVLSEHGKIIEIQGTCEKNPIDWDMFEKLKNIASSSAQHIFNSCNSDTLNSLTPLATEQKPNQSHTPFFSLSGRISKSA